VRQSDVVSATISPNPVIAVAQINFDAVPKTTRLSIFDVSGKEIFVQKIPRFESSLELALDFLPEGIYFLQLENDKSQLLKFLKHR